MAERLRLVVRTPSKVLVDAESVEWVHLKLAGAEALTIWPGHAPVLAETAAEAVRYRDQDGAHIEDLPSGILEVENGTVTLFLGGAPDGLSWSQEAEPARFDRLADTMLGALSWGTGTPGRIG